MDENIRVGERVKVFLDSKFGNNSGWFEGTVVRMDPYSKHRSFYWVELDEDSQAILGIRQISIFNPKNIQKNGDEIKMKIEHIAVWSKDIERLKAFYEKYFNATSNSNYTNLNKSYSSYFLTFSSGARLELMQMPSIPESLDSKDTQFTGYIHIAISTGSKEQVDQLTAQLKADGYKIMDGPRHTGDDYYESVAFDPDGNRIEITT